MAPKRKYSAFHETTKGFFRLQNVLNQHAKWEGVFKHLEGDTSKTAKAFKFYQQQDRKHQLWQQIENDTRELVTLFKDLSARKKLNDEIVEEIGGFIDDEICAKFKRQLNLHWEKSCGIARQEVEKLKREMRTRERAREDLEGELEGARLENIELEQEQEKLQRRVRELQESSQRLRRERDGLKSKLKLVPEKEELQRKVKELEDSNQSIAKARDDFQSELQRAQSEKLNADQEKEKLQRKVDELQKTNRILKHARDDFKSRLATAENHNVQVGREKEELQKTVDEVEKSEQSVSRERDEFASQLESIWNQKDDADKEILRMQGTAKEDAEKIKTLRAQLNAHREDNRDLSHRIDRAETKYQSDVYDLQKQRDRLQKDVDAANDKWKSESDARLKAEQQEQTLRQSVADKVQEKSVVDQELEESRNQLADEKRAVQELQHEALVQETTTNSKLEKCAREHELTKQKLQETERKVKEADQARVNAETEKEAADGKTAAQERLVEAEREAKDAVQQTLTKSEQDLRHKEEELKKAVERNNELQTSLDTARGEQTDAEQKMRESGDARTEVERKLRDVTDAKDVAQSNLTKVTREKSELNTQLEEKKKECAIKDQTIESTSNRSTELQQSLGTLVTDNTNLKKALDIRDFQNERLGLQLCAKEAARDSLAQEKTDLQTTMTKLQKTCCEHELNLALSQLHIEEEHKQYTSTKQGLLLRECQMEQLTSRLNEAGTALRAFEIENVQLKTAASADGAVLEGYRAEMKARMDRHAAQAATIAALGMEVTNLKAAIESEKKCQEELISASRKAVAASVTTICKDLRAEQEYREAVKDEATEDYIRWITKVVIHMRLVLRDVVGLFDHEADEGESYHIPSDWSCLVREPLEAIVAAALNVNTRMRGMVQTEKRIANLIRTSEPSKGIVTPPGTAMLLSQDLAQDAEVWHRGKNDEYEKAKTRAEKYKALAASATKNVTAYQQFLRKEGYNVE